MSEGSELLDSLKRLYQETAPDLDEHQLTLWSLWTVSAQAYRFHPQEWPEPQWHLHELHETLGLKIDDRCLELAQVLISPGTEGDADGDSR